MSGDISAADIGVSVVSLSLVGTAGFHYYKSNLLDSAHHGFHGCVRHDKVHQLANLTFAPATIVHDIHMDPKAKLVLEKEIDIFRRSRLFPMLERQIGYLNGSELVNFIDNKTWMLQTYHKYLGRTFLIMQIMFTGFICYLNYRRPHKDRSLQDRFGI